MGADPVEPLDWQFLQCFGERTPGEEIQEADIISAVEFDWDGQHLATGDRGGRVVLFDRIPSQPARVGPDQRAPPPRLSPFEYRYLTEFQSHEPEFDYLKSLEIEEKINQVRWCHSGAASLLLSTNDKTIKLWKVYEKKVVSLTDFNVADADSLPASQWSSTAGSQSAASPKSSLPGMERANKSQQFQLPLKVPKVSVTEVFWKARCQRTFASAHTYHINSISMNSDQETFISADDLRVNLWHLGTNDQSFNIVDIKPANMEDLTEVITAAEFHPSHCSAFAFSSSKGCIRLADMRAAALCDTHAKAFEATEPQGARSFFSEIISSVSDIKFTHDGRYILARDYMTLKLWDIHMESKPVATYPVHESLRSQLCDLYENDCIFDKFDCCVSGDGTRLGTGSYSNLFKVAHPSCAAALVTLPLWQSRICSRPMAARLADMETLSFAHLTSQLNAASGVQVTSTSPGPDSLLEASRDPLRKRLQQPSAKSNRFGLSRSKDAKKAAANAADAEPATPDFSAKLLHLAWHPEAPLIAAAASNSLYVYTAPPKA